MHDAKPEGRVPNSLGNALSVVLAAVNPYDDKLGRVSFFELPQLREYMNAVDSPVRPEIQERDLAAKIDEPQRSPSTVDPVQIVGKLGRPDSWRCVEFSRHQTSYGTGRIAQIAGTGLTRSWTQNHITANAEVFATRGQADSHTD